MRFNDFIHPLYACIIRRVAHIHKYHFHAAYGYKVVMPPVILIISSIVRLASPSRLHFFSAEVRRKHAVVLLFRADIVIAAQYPVRYRVELIHYCAHACPLFF